MAVFVIAEAALTWMFGKDPLANAFRSIQAAKDCGANAWKTQWTSDPALMAKRRNGDVKDFKILAYPVEFLRELLGHCDDVGIEFMTTVFLEKDIPTIAPLVKRFKVASAESGDVKFIDAHEPFKKQVIVSNAFGAKPVRYGYDIKHIHCVCSYPTPIEQLNVSRICKGIYGLSDHTTSVLSGAVAVGAGATIIEKHVRLNYTPNANPDYPHSLKFNPYHKDGCDGSDSCFEQYVLNVREAESMMGTGEHVVQECEKPNLSRRVVQ